MSSRGTLRRQSTTQSTSDDPGITPTVAESGWMVKAGGHTIRTLTWRKRFFVLDTADRLSYFDSDKLAWSGGRPLGIVRMRHVLFVTRRSSSNEDDRVWPPTVSRSLCINLVTEHRNYYMYCESEADAERWLRVLQRATGQATQNGMHVGEIRLAPSPTPSRSTPAPEPTPDGRNRTLSVGTTATTRSDLVDKYCMASLPEKVKESCIRWMTVLDTTLRRLSEDFRLSETMTYDCDMLESYARAPKGIRNRLGEFVFGDYPDELRYNLAPLSDHPIGRSAVLDVIPARAITFSIDNPHEPQLTADGPPHMVKMDEESGRLRITIDPARLGVQTHLVGCDLVDSLVVDKTLLSNRCGDLKGASVSVAIGVISSEGKLQNVLDKLSDFFPEQKPTVTFHCNWSRLEEETRNRGSVDKEGAEKANPLSRRLGQVIIEEITVPLLRKLHRACLDDKEVAKTVGEKLSKMNLECRPSPCLSQCCEVFAEGNILVIAVDPSRLVFSRQPGWGIAAVDVCRWLRQAEANI